MNQELTVDRSVHTALGDEMLTDLRSILHPVDCQTCGKRFTDSDELTLAVDALNGMAFAALHHKRCRPSDWRRLTGTASRSDQLTWRAGTFVWPDVDTAAILVNPSCEGAFFRRKGAFRRRWRLSTLDVYTDTGFQRGTAWTSPPAPARGLEIHLDTDQVTVGRLNVESMYQDPTARGPYIGGLPLAFIWQATILPDFHRKARAQNLLTVGVTSVLDPWEAQLTPGQVNRLMAEEKIVFTIAPITRFSLPAQALSKDDFDEERKLTVLSVLYEMVRRTLGIEMAAAGLVIAEALLEGIDMTDDFRRLGHQDQILTLAVLVGLYVGQRGPVHLMTPDPTTTQEYEQVLHQVLVPLDIQVEQADSRTRTTAKGVVLGTQEQFAAAWRRSGSAVSGAIGCGGLAVVIAPGPDFLSQDFMSRYARRLELRPAS